MKSKVSLTRSTLLLSEPIPCAVPIHEFVARLKLYATLRETLKICSYTKTSHLQSSTSVSKLNVQLPAFDDIICVAFGQFHCL